MKSGCLSYSLFFVIAMFLWQCNTSKTKLETSPPFTVVKATVNDWFGGQRGVKGTKVEFHIKNTSNIEFQKIYFENRIEKLYKRSNSNNTTVYTVNLNKNTRDFNMNGDPKKEYGNALPKKKLNFPFELEKDECIIIYLENKKEHFFKKKLKRLKAVYMA